MIVILAEHDGQHILPQTFAAIAAMQAINEKTMLVIAGTGASNSSDSVKAYVDEIVVVDHACFDNAAANPLSELLLKLAKEHQAKYIVAASTSQGKAVLPRVAAKLDVAQISDVIAIEGDKTFKRPIYAGNAIATVTALDAICVLTIRQSAFGGSDLPSKSAVVTELDWHAEDDVRFVSRTSSEAERVNLSSAEIVVSGGRGLKEKANFALIEKLADRLGAAVGASRAAVDAGWVANDLQVGQTGQIVAPKLYIAIGISGAIQHLAGMKDSGVIVAINNDADAPIFEIADYGLVADLFDVLEELDALLAA